MKYIAYFVFVFAFFSQSVLAQTVSLDDAINAALANNLNIQITPSQDCYMKIFYVHGTSAEIVFPIKVGANGKDYPIFRDEILPKDYTKTIDYLAPELEENEDSSQGKLIFVLTKKPYDYVDSEIDEDGYYTKTQINLIKNKVDNDGGE